MLPDLYLGYDVAGFSAKVILNEVSQTRKPQDGYTFTEHLLPP
jgi:hypothetical protein